MAGLYQVGLVKWTKKVLFLLSMTCKNLKIVLKWSRLIVALKKEQWEEKFLGLKHIIVGLGQCYSTGYTVYPNVYENKFGVYSWTEVYEGYTSSITGISSKTKLINFSSDVPLFHYHDLSLFSSAVTWARLHFSAILQHILQIFAAKVSQNAANLCS